MGAAQAALWVMILASIALAFLGLPLAGIYVYAPELYPTEMRALGTGVASSWLRIASIVGPILIGVLLTFGDIGHVYAFLCITAASGALGTQLLGVETRPRAAAIR